MSIFITLLAFEDSATIRSSKLCILLASVVAGTIGYVTLRGSAADFTESEEEADNQ